MPICFKKLNYLSTLLLWLFSDCEFFILQSHSRGKACELLYCFWTLILGRYSVCLFFHTSFLSKENISIFHDYMRKRGILRQSNNPPVGLFNIFPIKWIFVLELSTIFIISLSRCEFVGFNAFKKSHSNKLHITCRTEKTQAYSWFVSYLIHTFINNIRKIWSFASDELESFRIRLRMKTKHSKTDIHQIKTGFNLNVKC